MTYEEWLTYGLEHGYSSPRICATHDGIPTTFEEDQAFDGGDDPCVVIIRLYVDSDEKAAVEENFTPAQWRS